MIATLYPDEKRFLKFLFRSWSFHISFHEELSSFLKDSVIEVSARRRACISISARCFSVSLALFVRGFKYWVQSLKDTDFLSALEHSLHLLGIFGR